MGLNSENLQYPENVQKEEPIKELLAQIYTEVGAVSYHIHKEKQVDVYLPRIDILSLLRPAQVSCFEGTIFQYLSTVVCFEVHTRSLDENTFAKWQIEVIGLFLMIAADFNFHYQNFVGFSILEHVPENIFTTLPKEVIMPLDPGSKEQPCFVKIAGMIPWFFILKPCLRYDLFCLPANLMLPERHPQLIADLKEHRYKCSHMLEELSIKVLDNYYQNKGATTMLDIGSILEKSNEPSFVHFRKCRDMLLNQGREAGKVEGELQAKRSTLLRILEKRLGAVPTRLQDKISEMKDISKIEELIDQAISVATIEQLKL